jgi:DegV family protein with EDD domain
MLRIVLDSAGDLPEGWQEQFGIDIIPINIIHNGKTYLQGVDMKYEDFYQLVENEGAIPSTSQPTPYQFTEFYRQIAKPGDQILSIHITEKLSGTMASAKIAAQELSDEFEIRPFDSASGTLVMGMMAKEARILDRAGKTIDEIIQRLEEIRNQHRLMFTLDTLKYASLSGRIKHLQAALASLLKVKPIIELRNGTLEMGEKVRSRAKSIELMLKKMEKEFGDKRLIVGVAYARDKKAGTQLMKDLIERFNCAEVIIGEISISLAAHFGPGTLGITAYPA